MTCSNGTMSLSFAQCVKNAHAVYMLSQVCSFSAGPSAQTNILASASAVNETITFLSGVGAPNSIFVNISLTDDQVALEAVEWYIIGLEIALDTSTAIRIGSPNTTFINVLDNDGTLINSMSHFYLQWFLTRCMLDMLYLCYIILVM